jgi:hypothetical protein
VADPRPTEATPPAQERVARRQLVLTVVLVAGLARLVEGPVLWPATLLLAAAVAVAVLRSFAPLDPAGVPVESLLLPAAAAGAALLVLHLLPVGLPVLVGLVIPWVLVGAAVLLEDALLRQRQPAEERQRRLVTLLALAMVFLGAAGARAVAVGGGPDPWTPGLAPTLLSPLGGTGAEATAAAGSGAALQVVLAQGILAGVVGFRLAAIRRPRLAFALGGAASAAAVVAAVAGLILILRLPLLLGAALLALVLYLWDVVHGALALDRRRGWLLDLVLLAALGVVAAYLGVQP